MPIFIIIYCFQIKFEGNRKYILPHSFTSLLKCYWMSTCGYLLTSGETSQALLITMWCPPLAFNFKHNTNTPSICLLERKKIAYLTALLIIQAENTHKGQGNRWRLLCVALLIVPVFEHGRLRNIPLSHTVMDNSQRSRCLLLRQGWALNEMQGHFSHQGSFVRPISFS